jgi:hypothetical protein
MTAYYFATINEQGQLAVSRDVPNVGPDDVTIRIPRHVTEHSGDRGRIAAGLHELAAEILNPDWPGDQLTAPPHIGACPRCGEDPAIFSLDRDGWALCRRCKVAWRWGPGKFGCVEDYWRRTLQESEIMEHPSYYMADLAGSLPGAWPPEGEI